MKWNNLPNTPKPHGWAFYYYLIKRGERVTIIEQNGRHGPLSIFVHTVPESLEQLEAIDC